ncbi:MAG TPA: ABC transporter permease [Myxococcaceae bacterium]|nr:ABC transporter permease [Myxococcaceae bacterium]
MDTTATARSEPGTIEIAVGSTAQSQQLDQVVIGAVSVIAFLVLWELSIVLGWINPLFTSSPRRIVVTAIELFRGGAIYRDLLVSGAELLAGYTLAVLVAIPLGIGMGWYRRMSAALEPFVTALYATPRIALLPLIVIWFGIGLGSKIAIIFLGAIFPILVNTITGVRTVDRDLVRVARSLCAGDWQLFRTVVLPSAVPLILTGLRLGLGHALVGIVVGELYAATAGIGFMIAVAGSSFQTDKVMVGILIISVAGVLMTHLLRMVERRFERWRADNRQ